jgi:hypothetical protein
LERSIKTCEGIDIISDIINTELSKYQKDNPIPIQKSKLEMPKEVSVSFGTAWTDGGIVKIISFNKNSKTYEEYDSGFIPYSSPRVIKNLIDAEMLFDKESRGEGGRHRETKMLIGEAEIDDLLNKDGKDRGKKD